MLFKKNVLTLNRVHDTVVIAEGGEKIKLHVDADPMRMVAGLNQVQRMFQALNENSSEEEARSAAMYYAAVIFGHDQADQLAAFYHNDAGCIIGICGRYFTGRLNKLITAAQKKIK